MSWPSESDLESIDSIIERMNPILNFPYPMKSSKNETFPKSKGDPWIGAYTKNGYWYRLSWGGKEDWDEIVPEISYRSGFLKDSKSAEIYKNVLKPSAELKLLVVKNIRGEVLGCAEIVVYSKFTIFGSLFVNEDFRHVGIGMTMMIELVKEHHVIAMNSVSYLLSSAEKKFGLVPRICRRILRITIHQPQGFENLKSSLPDIIVKSKSSLTSEDYSEISKYSESLNHPKIDWSAYPNIHAVFNENEKCVGVAVLQEIQNDKDILPQLYFSPIYADSEELVEVLMSSSLRKYYNPEDDYDFDVDYSAIYRRTVDFYVFSENLDTSFYKNIIKKLSPSKTEIHPQFLQTCSNFLLPSTTHAKVWALSDPNIFLY